MAILTLPATVRVVRLEWGQRRNDLEFNGGDAGGTQARILAPPRWTAGIVCPEAISQSDAALWRSLILRLNGRVHQLALHDLGNPVPRGTLRGALTLNAQAVAGSTVLSIAGGLAQAGFTLLEGDWIGVGGGSTVQLVSVASNVVANASGVISVTISQPMRYTQAAASVVVWDKPTALFRTTSTDSRWVHDRAIRSGYSLDLIESWAT